MARFSALSLLVTVFYFLLCATHVSTPSHSDVSLRTIEIVPLVYPVLTISAPPPVRSPCAGVNRCGKSPIFTTLASKIAGSVNKARNYLNARNLIRPYLLQIGRYVHQVTDTLGRPTADSMVGLALLQTTGKLAAPPLAWARVDKVPVARAPPPPPPTRTFSVYVPASPTSGPSNPPGPTTGYTRPRNTEPVVKANWDDWFAAEHAMFAGSALVLTVASFVLSFQAALCSVKCVEHRDTKNDEVAPNRDVVRSVVPPMTSSVPQVIQNSSPKLTTNPQQNPVRPSCATPPAGHSPLVVAKRPNQFSNPVIFRAPALLPNQSVLQILHLPTDYLLRSSLPDPQRAGPLTKRHIPLPIEWNPTSNEGANLPKTRHLSLRPDAVYIPPLTPIPATPTAVGSIRPIPRLALGAPSAITLYNDLCPAAFQLLRRCVPLLIEWHVRQKNIISLAPSIVVEHSLPVALTLTTDYSYTSLLTQRPRHLVRALTLPTYAHVTHTTNASSFGHASHNSQDWLQMEWNASLQVNQSSSDEVETAAPATTSTPALIVHPDSPPRPKAPLRIPPSFHRYANIRLEDLGAHPPGQRDELLRREVRVAEDRYRHEKPRRDRARLELRWRRAEMDKKGGRLSSRLKCKEQVEEEEELERVMRARRRGEEEVFEGVGGPPQAPPIPDWLQVIIDGVRAMKSTSGSKRKDGMVKGILKKGASKEEGTGKEKKKKKSRVVRWADELGRKLAL